MALYVGETVTVYSRAVDPATGLVYADLDAEVEFYAPGKSPKTVPADRTRDKGPFAMTWDAQREQYLAYVDTTGWAAGRWTYKVTLTGGRNSWEYGVVALKA